jgi:ABC-2 type transport system permease protein
MHKLTRVLIYELRTTLLRPSFLIITFGIPLVLLALYGIRSLTMDDQAQEKTPTQPALKSEGYVDLAGLVRELPGDLPAGILQSFQAEDLAQEAMQAGKIQSYYIIPTNYLHTGELVYVRPDYSPLSDEGNQDWIMRWTLLYNLLGGEQPLASRVWVPAEVFITDLTIRGSGLAEGCPIPGYTCESSILLRYLPLIVLVVFMVAIITTASTLLQNMSKEKENRLLEVLLISASPGQLLAGKILGLGIIGLLQVSIWLGTIFAIFNHGQAALSLPADFSIPPDMLVWGLIFFLLGYAEYAFLMAGAGAMIPDAKSYSSTAMLVASPMYLGYLVTIFSSYGQDSPLAVALSLFPLTSPVTMTWRMAHGSVPAWQLLLAVALLIAATILVARAVSRMFRAQVLLSGQPFHIQHYLSALWHPDAAV